MRHLLTLWPLCLFLCATTATTTTISTAPWWGDAHDLYERDDIRRRVVALTAEVQTDSRVRELERKQQCFPSLHTNTTLAPILYAMDRCPNPLHRIRKISADAIVWTRVPKSQAKKKKRPGSSSTNNSTSSTGSSSKNATDSSKKGEDDGPRRYMAFLLTVVGDKFSAELKALSVAVSSAFPEVVFLCGDAEQFSSLAAELSLKGFPQLLLFEDGILKDRFRGKRDVPNLVRFFVDNTASLPRCLVEPLAVPETPPRVTWLYGLSCIYVALRMGYQLYSRSCRNGRRRRASRTEERPPVPPPAPPIVDAFGQPHQHVD